MITPARQNATARGAEKAYIPSISMMNIKKQSINLQVWLII
ncbi:hypothetical protein BN137_1555 [Cronobacter condimenti 1330]|uniref:Uncharacterized protein n=1 Tax=Cronobacter condimenti 1330 TaxID=1073999 RepID=K8A0D3_9ENTR|nr:hypothetical protein BN137_1555 [Cronobacter condimenti 1330]